MDAPHDDGGGDEHAQEAEALRLAPGLIHEMRQPLLGIRAGIELLAREAGQLVSPLEGFLLIATQTERLEELMRGFQELFGASGAGSERFALQPVLERAIALLRFRLRRLGDRFACVGAEPSVLCSGRPGALLHALTNVIGNAADAVDAAGGGRVEVRVLAPTLGPREVRVSDDGTGIPSEGRARLFRERFTTKAPGEGSGLGLRVAQEAMRRCGGTVRLVGDADPSRAAWARTEFCLEVPAAS
jgi:C4-dicarboxylate-specific signal transduction histidine kinase